MIRSILGGGEQKSPEEKFEDESLAFAQARVTAFAGQPVENQTPIASYHARFDPYNPELQTSSVFDISILKPGAIMRINMGGHDYFDESMDVPAQIEKIYEYVVAGKRDKEGKLRLYEVYSNNEHYAPLNPFEPNLILTPYGFELVPLNYKLEEEPYKSTQFPIYLAKDYLRLAGQDWNENWKPNRLFAKNPFWPDTFLPNSIDIMEAGEKEKKPTAISERRPHDIFQGIGSLIPQPIRYS